MYDAKIPMHLYIPIGYVMYVAQFQQVTNQPKDQTPNMEELLIQVPARSGEVDSFPLNQSPVG